MASYFKRVAEISKTMKIAEVSGMIQQNSNVKEVEVRPSVNHVICIDISGSMYEVLPKIRLQLKSRLVDIVNDGDTVSIIWFDDRCGFVSEMTEISNVNDVREMNKKIDQMLTPGGCTNFLDPVILTNKLISRMNSSKGLWSFFFMSDGGHNTGGGWNQVISELTCLQEKVSNAVICEYGYWADSDRLTQMAEVLGGQKIFDKDFDEYKADFENVIKTGSTETVKRVEFDITDFKSSMKLQFMFTVDKDSKSIRVYSTDRVNKILIPENTERIYYIQKNSLQPMDSDTVDLPIESKYAAVYLLAERLKYNLAEELLYGIGDKNLIDMYCNSFGKQKLEEFKSAVLDRVYGVTLCSDYLKDNKYRPNPKKYCVMDFIDDITSDESGLVHLTHPDFKYNYTSARSVKKVELTDEDRSKLSKSLTKSKADKILSEASKYQVEYKYKDSKMGYPVSSLTWNNERANVSFMVRIPVELSVPDMNDKSKRFNMDSFITRNFTIIKDGVLNVDELIITVGSSLRGKFKRMRMVTEDYGNGTIKVNISQLPIINKKRSDTVYSIELETKEMELLRCRCMNKYIAYLIKSNSLNEEDLKISKSIMNEKDKYLKSLGISNNGYTPKTEVSKSGDFYIATTLETKLEEFSNLPKIEDVFRKLKSSKAMTPSEEYMYDCMKVVDEVMKNSNDQLSALGNLSETYKDMSKGLLEDISKMKFILLVSRKWFADKGDFDDNSVKVKVCGSDLNMSFVFSEKKVDL